MWILGILLGMASPDSSSALLASMRDLDALANCVVDKSDILITQRETAATIVDSAFQLCEAPERAFRTSAMAAFTTTSDPASLVMAEERVDSQVTNLRRRLVASVLERRALWEKQNPGKRPPWR